LVGSYKGGSLILSVEEYAQFRSQVESQAPRVLKRYLDFDKRLNSGQGLNELRQWLAKILLDDGAIYTIEDKAKGFEILCCLEIAAQWTDLEGVSPESVTLAGKIDKTRLYRAILDGEASPGRRAALIGLFQSRYRKSWSWIAACSVQVSSSDDGPEPTHRLMAEFLTQLDRLDPVDSGPTSDEVHRLEAQVADKEEGLRKLNRELEVARERADRALERLESRDAELGALNKQLQSERENGDKLRQERSRRIRIEREVREKGKELEDLRGEYVKLDGRLRDASQRGLAGGLDLAALRNLDPSRILGLTAPTTEEELSQIRRRFASVFHSDRSSQLPGWVSQLFDQLLGIVNEACDRLRK